METRTDTQITEREAMVVNRNLAIEVSYDEILEDLLFSAHRAEAAR
jgi:hypothetical protein